jgi:hypothetical protein
MEARKFLGYFVWKITILRQQIIFVSAPRTSIQKLVNIDRRKLVEILVSILKEVIDRFIQLQHHNITSDKWSDQNNERFYYVKQTVENGWRCDITISIFSSP